MGIKTKLPWKKIFLVGIFVGALDLSAAFIDAWFTFHLSPIKVLNYIASAAMGKNKDGHSIIPAFSGLIFHFLIATCFTFLFYFLYDDLKNFFKSKILVSIAYGLFIWAFMRFIVLPLTPLHLSPFILIKQIKSAVILILAMGSPLTFLISRMKIAQKKTEQNRIDSTLNEI